MMMLVKTIANGVSFYTQMHKLLLKNRVKIKYIYALKYNIHSNSAVSIGIQIHRKISLWTIQKQFKQSSFTLLLFF